ncbi:single-stranded DNA-binding protein [Edaphosphingomonas haloaromaticamans]|uniref:Single-stranded DNA-binding protein n=1 Tax=Edaphosphingomonas haloaromaticamans TaxID=653954 RepID=A0A1S1HEZ2_9SPHN|nr:single-stranded DNA-binding protein [Sphingomonas haloaromaticamans]OHT20081.1 Single-stranded DNA-binding protein [Sphingomonas haloaromaticamans]
MQNIVILAGNLGADPESRTTQGGTNITSIRLATSRPRYKDGKIVRDEQGRRVQDTEWHRITCFNGLGKTVQEHCTSGMKLLVRGRIHYTKWTDQQGNDRYGCEIIAETVDFLSRGKPAQKDEGYTGNYNDLDDDIPF